MIKLDWHKMNEQLKAKVKSIRPLVLVLASGYVEPAKLQSTIKDLAKDGSTVLIGVLTDDFFPGLQNGQQFQPASYEAIETIIKSLPETVIAPSKLGILLYDAQNVKYLIRELAPNRIIRFNGTWVNVLHYQKEFWEAYDLGLKIETISPFDSEKSAISYSQKLYKKNEAELAKEIASLQRKTKNNLSDQQLMDIAVKTSYLSWDWTGRTGAVIAQEGRILSWAENVVLPYPGAMLHSGSLREQNHVPIGESLEFYETNHAEPSALLKLIKNKVADVDIAKCTLYTTKFPCPFCARIIADSGLKKVVYLEEYTNAIGYQVLSGAQVNCQKL